jgi:flagellar hook assembly protein FlgD
LTISVGQKGCREKINTIKIYDLKGRLVFRASIPGSDSYLWDGKDSSGRPVSSGIYFLQAKDIDNKIYPAKIVRIK